MRRTILSFTLLFALPWCHGLVSIDKPVVAHFMVGNAYPYTRDDWARDMNLAAAKGIDGFALNMGNDAWQLDRIADAYDVARSMGGKFALFPSFDMGTIPCSQESDGDFLRGFVYRYHDHSNQLVFRGNPVVSSFGGQFCTFGQGTVNDGWKRVLKRNLPGVHFIASFFMDPGIYGSMDAVDGAFSWDSAWPMGNYDITDAYDVEYQRYLKGRTYMAGVSPWFFTHYGADTYNKNFIFRADDWLLAQRWEILVRERDQTDIVQVISWNDYGESHYIGPIAGAQPGSESWTTGFDHQGWLDLQTYYIMAYKTGTYPTVYKDRLFLWGRLYPAKAQSPDPLGPPRNADWTEDFVWVVALLKSPAQLGLGCGKSTLIVNAPAGRSKHRLPLVEDCSVTAVVVRDKSVVLKFAPEGYRFSTNPPMYNFNATCPRRRGRVSTRLGPIPSSYPCGRTSTTPNMPPKSSSQPAKKGKLSQAKINVVKLGCSQPFGTSAKRKFDPLSAFSKPSAPKIDRDTSNILEDVEISPKRPAKRAHSFKGKEKAPLPPDDRMWVDIYEPQTEAELAVHVRKVEDVRRWLQEAFEGGPSGKLKKYRRILALTGPAGTGKTSTIKVLSKELGFEIVEWRNSIGEVTPSRNTPGSSSGSYFSPSQDFDDDSESQFTKFETFFNRATSCRNLFSTAPSASNRRKQIILLEDLPNILHPKIQAEFHACLEGLTESPLGDPPIPVVVVISDAGIRGEARDERISGGGGWGRDKDQVMDVRTVLPRDLLHGPYVTQISFNPIAPTLMKKALQSMVNTHFSTVALDLPAPSKQVLEVIVESSNGDIRSAINTLEFACTVELPSKRRKGVAAGTTIVLEAVTRREQSLALFHLIGKVLYNKRKGDPPSSSAAAKDIQKEREIDTQLKDPAKLPRHLAEHDRRASRVDVDGIYADSPIDSSLFSLYLHQNYTQFCNEVEEVDGVADWLSWVDSSGGEAVCFLVHEGKGEEGLGLAW
ncbi:hypothetical protein NMY22_g9870 [Coprinellus aureogranulatus]|nr:hypothetical protein NMY22_g9870 [Coprinellus aureogranulatus]